MEGIQKQAALVYFYVNRSPEESATINLEIP